MSALINEPNPHADPGADPAYEWARLGACLPRDHTAQTSAGEGDRLVRAEAATQDMANELARAQSMVRRVMRVADALDQMAGERGWRPMLLGPTYRVIAKQIRAAIEGGEER